MKALILSGIGYWHQSFANSFGAMFAVVLITGGLKSPGGASPEPTDPQPAHDFSDWDEAQPAFFSDSEGFSYPYLLGKPCELNSTVRDWSHS